MGAGKHSAGAPTDYKKEKKIETGELKDKVKKPIDFVKILIIFTIIFVIAGSALAAKIVIKNKSKKPVEETVPVVAETLAEQYEGFDVLGMIKIEKLNVEQYILDSNESVALDKGVTKLCGGVLNGYGNFVIAGHNKENVFEKLNELEVGDTFTIIDKNLKETKYEIKEFVSVEPDDLSVLIPDEEKREITLITCENGSTTRLVVKAEKYNYSK